MKVTPRPHTPALLPQFSFMNSVVAARVTERAKSKAKTGTGERAAAIGNQSDLVNWKRIVRSAMVVISNDSPNVDIRLGDESTARRRRPVSFALTVLISASAVMVSSAAACGR